MLVAGTEDIRPEKLDRSRRTADHRPSRRWLSVLGALALLVTSLAALRAPGAARADGLGPAGADAATVTIHVDPAAGSDAASGVAGQPLRTLGRALAVAQPGTEIRLADGDYVEAVATVRAGRADAPIRVVGGADAVLRGSGGNRRVFDVKHSWTHLIGFTIDGRLPGSPDVESSYGGRLVYVSGTSRTAMTQGVLLRGLTLRNALGECIRFKYARAGEVADNVIGPCGFEDFRFGGGGVNGEGVYIGTAPEQEGPSGPDPARWNWVHDNVVATDGAECIEFKENATDNLAERNRCTGGRYVDGGLLVSRGNGNTFRDNQVSGNVGAGARMGGDTSTQGVGNHLYRNQFSANALTALLIQRGPQGVVCGNTTDRLPAVSGSAASDALERAALSPCPAGTGSEVISGVSVGLAVAAELDGGLPPAATVPPTTVPSPTTTVPPTTVPSPPTTVPPTTVPPTTGPPTTAPPTTVPPTTVPPTTVPAPTVPPTTGPPPQACGVPADRTPFAMETEAMLREGAWRLQTGTALSSGAGTLFPEDGRSGDPASRLVVTLDVAVGRSVDVWVRGGGPDGGSNSVRTAFDGGKLTTAHFRVGDANWVRASTSKLSAGRHTFAVSARESGTVVDKVVIQPSGAAAPSGSGPAASCGT